MKKTVIITLSIILILGLGISYILLKQSNGGPVDKNNQDGQNNNEEQNEGDMPVNQQTVKADNGLTFEIEETEAANSGKAFNYTVLNNGTEEVELSFTTSQRYEYELRNVTEGTTTKYSDRRAFMQVLGETMLTPGESVSYEISLPQLKPGEYQLTVYLVAKNMSDYVVSTSFVVEE